MLSQSPYKQVIPNSRVNSGLRKMISSQSLESQQSSTSRPRVVKTEMGAVRSDLETVDEYVGKMRNRVDYLA